MRTILLLGVAAGTLLLAGRASSAEPAPAGAPKLEYGTPATPDVRVYTGSPDRVPSEVDYRQVSGTYDAEGRWSGTWDGTYESPDGRRYEGRYEGTVEGVGAGYPPPPEYDPRYGGPDPRDADMARRCGHGGGGGGQIGGAVIGGVVGGVIGNRVAGHGDRTAGTLIGGGVGALAGSAIGNAADKKKCDEWWSTRGGYHHGGGYYGYGYPGTTVYQQGGYASSGYGYGWYSPGVVVVTTITTPAVTERVETTTRTYYENAPVRKRYVAKKKWKPRPKPRCAC